MASVNTIGKPTKRRLEPEAARHHGQHNRYLVEAPVTGLFGTEALAA